MATNLICLCGSTRFAADFELAVTELSKFGLSVITIASVLPRDLLGHEFEPALKEMLDLVHLNKILRSDAIYVVGDGYLGYSTCREILWALMQGKPMLLQNNQETWEVTAHRLVHGPYDEDLPKLAEERLKAALISRGVP